MNDWQKIEGVIAERGVPLALLTEKPIEVKKPSGRRVIRRLLKAINPRHRASRR